MFRRYLRSGWPIVLIFSFGIILSFVAYGIVDHYEKINVKADIRLMAQDSVSAIDREITSNIGLLESVVSFYSASREVEREEFRKFVEVPLKKYRSIHAIEFVRRVSVPARTSYEAFMQQQGFRNFTIKDTTDLSQLVPSSNRTEYFPIHYVEPFDENRDILGFDHGSLEERLKVIQQARDSGEIKFSKSLKLLKRESGFQDQYGFLSFYPVYQKKGDLSSIEGRRKYFIGFVAGIFKLNEVVNSALSQFKPRGLDIYIYDESSLEESNLVYFYPSRTRKGEAASSVFTFRQFESVLDYKLSENISILDLNWTVEVIPTADFVRSKRGGIPFIIFLLSLLITGMVTFYLISLRKSTSKLRVVNKDLKHEISLRRKTEELEKERSRVLEQLMTNSDLSTILTTITKCSESMRPGMLCSILLLDDKKEYFKTVVAPSLPVFYNESVGKIKIGFGVGSCGTAAYTKQRVIVEDVQTHPYWKDYRELAKKVDVRSCWSEPILSSHGEILGTFAIYYRTPCFPTPYDLDIIKTSARLAEIVIDKKNADEKISQQTAEQKHINEELDRVNSHLQKLVSIDPLTGFLNRRGFQETLFDLISQKERFNQHFFAVMIDIDYFKTVNDTFGYVAGDQVIKEVAVQIRKSIRKSDKVARIGGDEFIVLLPGIREAEAVVVAQKIRFQIAHVEVGTSTGKVLNTTASIGIVPVMQDSITPDELIEKASFALRESKQRGKNVVTLHTKKGDKNQDGETLMSEAMHRLRDGKYFYALQQEIMNIQTQTVTGYELLTRFDHPDFSSPDDFFQIALEAKILTFVDRSCLKACIETTKKLQPGKHVHVNLFPSTLMEASMPRLIEEFQQVLDDHPLCVEISEQQIIGDSHRISRAVNKLKKAGILVSMDDVGFGSSCLESLILLEPDIVKVDKKCIQGLSKHAGKKRSLERLLRVIRSCNAEIIAEGIETKEDLRILSDFGVEFGQGYLFGKPAPPKKAAARSSVIINRICPK